MDINVASTIAAASDRLGSLGKAVEGGLPGGLAVTAILLILIACWSLAGTTRRPEGA